MPQILLPHCHLKTLLATAFCLLAAGYSQAQVNIVNKPFRAAGSPETSSKTIGLSIAPYVAPTPNLAPAPAVVSASTVAPVIASAVAPVTPQVAAIAQRWEVALDDQTLSRAIGRWARQEGLQFFWEAPKDLVAVKATYSGSFDNAMRTLMLDTPASGYPLHACRHDNAVRILHTSQPCNR